MEEVSRLKKSLSGLKGRLKVIAKDLTKACGTEHESLLMEEIITSLEALATKARKTQDELESSLPEEEIEREVENYMAMERTIRELRVEARRRLKKPAEDQPARVKGTENDGSSAPVLPKWNLPKFDGNVLLFTAFWDQFEAGVHSRSDIGDVTKFVYLRTCLEGAALDAIAGYSVTGANYNAAVTTLKSRFGRPKLIAEKHILELVQMEKCTRPTVTELRRLHDGMSSNVRALVALNKDPNNETLSAAEVLLAVLKQKLPTIVRKRWEKQGFRRKPGRDHVRSIFRVPADAVRN
uniref:Uncharacterized protein n=1 Tax=Trichuris muris TaxID=70415 RepID=A0A5S6Q6R0_TRIMR